MTLAAELREMLAQTLSVEPPGSRDAFGMISYGAAVSYATRVVAKATVVRNREGQEVVSRTHAWLPPEAVISAESRVTLPDGTRPPILAIESYPDETGETHHQKVFFE